MKTVAVIFGGQSVEHDVSIVTAISSVIKPLELTKKYQVAPIYITKKGEWYSDDALKDITLYTSGKIVEFVRKNEPMTLTLDGGLSLLKKTRLQTKKQNIDIVFPAMHGTNGEDGALMGMLEMVNVPYVGCSMPASALAMDKVLAKTVTAAAGIPVTEFRHFSKQYVHENIDVVIAECEKSLSYPLFVKPPHLGSSIGITKAVNKTELKNAIEVALHYDDSVLIEEAVNNLIEVTLPIMGNDRPIPALLEKPQTQDEEFFDFETKYMRGGKKGKSKSKGVHGYSELPAKLPHTLYEKAESVGVAVYKALGCSGIARVDMLIDNKSGRVYFNEVNPLPGGLYAHNWAQKGVSKVELVEKLIQYAEERAAARQQQTSFDTSYLTQF